MLKFVDLVISKQCKLLEFKFETYIITIIFILPFTLLDYRYIFQSIGLLITYYYFLSALLLPLASYIFVHFEYTLFYPSAAFVSKQRKPVHIIATVISCYPEDVLFESHTDIYYYYPAFQTFTPVKFTITFICHSKFFFHDIGIYDMRTASFIHFYFGILNKERFFINYNYPLYCWYIQLHKYIEQNWRNCYS